MTQHVLLLDTSEGQLAPHLHTLPAAMRQVRLLYAPPHISTPNLTKSPRSNQPGLTLERRRRARRDGREIATTDIPSAPSATTMTGKRRFSYNQIHTTIAAAANDPRLRRFQPTLIISIGGGGFIPARILRTFLKQQNGKNVPIQAIGLTLYEDEDGGDPLDRPVRKTQWLTYGSHEAAVKLQGHNILIVDEVDDSRKTLAYAVEELQKDIAAERQDFLDSHCTRQEPPTELPCGTPPDNGAQRVQTTHCSEAGAGSITTSSRLGAATLSHQQQAADKAAAAAAAGWREPQLGIFVVHNKLKPKKAQLPGQLMAEAYFAAADIPDQWVVYPWDAQDIWEHTAKAEGRPSLEEHASKAQERTPLAVLNG